jgi:hypothetical protein
MCEKEIEMYKSLTRTLLLLLVGLERESRKTRMPRPSTLTVALFLACSVLFLSRPALAEEPVYTVDISHWQGEITPDQVACMWDSGVRHLIAGVLNPGIAANQLETASNGGMTVDIYVYLYWSGNITAQVQNALAVGAPYPVQRLWLDAENAPGSFTHAQIVQKLQEAVNACGSTPCGIYTRKVWWRDNTGNSTAFFTPSDLVCVL